MQGIQIEIEGLWHCLERKQPIPFNAIKEVLDPFLRQLDKGEIRVATPENGDWLIHDWVKKGILLCLRYFECELHKGSAPSWDKIPVKTGNWDESLFINAGYRAVHGAIARRGAFIAPNVVQMPSYINIGAYVDSGTMVDTWAGVGSCAQIGKNCHISGGAGIGGVLEPLQASPVIIEDHVFIGARSEIVEGVRVRKGAVIGMGVFIGQSTPIVDRQTGDITFGEVPENAVVLSGTLPSKPLPNGKPGPHMPCAIIVKTADKSTREKTDINELLRQEYTQALEA